MTIISFSASRFVDNISKVKILNLDYSKQNTADEQLELTVKASNFFQRFELTQLNLSGIHVTGAVVDNICKAFGADLQCLEYLIMNNCNLNSETVINFMQILKIAKNIKKIELCNNDIDDEATETLAIAILHWNLLECIKLEENHFTKISTKLFEILKNINACYTLIHFNGRIEIIAFITLLGYMTDIDIKNSILVENVSKIKKLHLDCSEQNNVNVQFEFNASKFFTRFVSLVYLNLSGIVISEEVADNLANALDSNLCSLEHLIMNNCQLTSVKVFNIIKKLHKCVNMRELRLCNNRIDDEIAEALAIAILHWDSFETLKVEDTRLSEQTRSLFKLLTEDFRSESIIFSNAYSVKSFISVLDYVGFNDSKRALQFSRNATNTTTLLLTYNQHQSVLALSPQASNFFQNFTALKVLNISGIIIDRQAANMLGNAFGNNLIRSLKYLILSNCGLTSEIFENLLMQLKSSANMEKLEWCCNNAIGDEAIEAIATAILSWNSLQSIEYSKECFTPKCVLFLDLMMKRDASTSVINFNYDYYAIKSFITVLNNLSEYSNDTVLSFKANVSKTTELSLDCSQFTTKVELPFQTVAFLNNLTYLIKLNVSGTTIGEDITDIFVSVFKANLQRLQYLFMNNCQLHSTVVIEFAKALQDRNIRELKMCDNLIDDEATEALVVAFLRWNSPQIELRNNKFSDISQLLLGLITNEFNCKYDTIKIKNDVGNIKLFLAILDQISNKKFKKNNSNVLVNISKVCALSLICSFQERIQLKKDQSKSFKYFKNLSQLEINGIIICEEAAKIISMSFARNHSNKLEVLKLNYCQLNSHSALMFLSMQNAVALQELDLSNNAIEDDATHSLIKTLLKMPKLEMVNLDANKFKHQNINILTEHLLIFKEMKSSKIRFYDSKQVAAFLTLLNCMKNISRDVSCQVNNISRMDKLHIKCLESILFTKNMCLYCKQLTYLRKLKLISIHFTSKVITILADCLAKCFPILEKLAISNCSLDSESAVRLLSTDRETIPVSFRHLRTIDFSCNLIEDVALQPLVNSFLQMPELQKLHFYGNRFTNIVPILSIFCDCKNYAKNSEIDYSKRHGSRVCINALLDVLSCIKDSTVERSCHVQSIIKIKSLNLEYYHNNPIVLTENLAKFFRRFIGLTELNLSGIHIHPEAIKSIADILQHNCGLLKLKLSHCQLDSDSVVRLLPSNKPTVPVAYKVLKEIDLSDNIVCDKAIVPLAASLLQMCQLEKLHFDNNQFKKYNINTIFQIVMEFKMTKPAIAYFSNEKDSLNCVASFLALLSSAKNVSLETSQRVKNLMNLSRLTLCCTNKFKQCVLFEESSFFFERFTLLQTLNLIGIKIQLQAVTVFAKALAVNLRSLEELNLSACGLTSETTIEIVSSLRKEKIKILCLSHNEIDHNATKMISGFMTNNNIITEINISHNNLTTKGTVTLTEGLANCRNLEKLDLSSNEITDAAAESLQKLSKQLYQYKNFKCLQIDNNNLSKQTIEAVQSTVSWSMWFKHKIRSVLN